MVSGSSPSPFNARQLRRALGNFATGVTVVTAAAQGRKVGVTVNSFNSVSLDPPLILWSLAKHSRSYAVFQTASHFAVNILAHDQLNLSEKFAQQSVQHFRDVACRLGLGGAILLEGTSANLQCEMFQMVEGGDHWILIGKVVAIEHHGRAPLLYHQGAYAAVQPHPDLTVRACPVDDSRDHYV